MHEAIHPKHSYHKYKVQCLKAVPNDWNEPTTAAVGRPTSGWK